MNIIELHERHGGMPIFLNVEKIVAFYGHHHLGKGWEFSTIHLEGVIQEVKETKEEILMAIIQAKRGDKPVLSKETIDSYRLVAPHSLW